MKPLQRSSLLVVLTALAVAPAAQADVGGGDIVGFVNAQRAANGLPAGITEDAAASGACAAYATGPHVPGPQNVPPPASSVTWMDGARIADHYGPWTATSNPLEPDADAMPYVLAPRLASFGAADVGGYGCATLPARESLTGPAPAADVTYSYPGDGVADAHTSPVIDESLVTAAGAAGYHETGAPLYVLFDGPDLFPAEPGTATVTASSLTGPDGAPVPLDVRDATTPGFTARGLPTEVQLIPRDPLAPLSRYTASVTADVVPHDGWAARSFTRTWSFTTGALENVVLPPWTAEQAEVPEFYKIVIYSRAPQVTVTATGPGTPVTATGESPLGTTHGAHFALTFDRPGTWHVCATSGGGTTGYRAAWYCWDTPGGAAAAPLPLAPPRPPAPKLKVSLVNGAKARWRGRVVTVRGVRCSAACSLRVAATVRAGGTSYRLKTARAQRRTAGVVTIRYTMSKSAFRKVRRAHRRRLALSIQTSGGGRAVHATLAA